MEYYDFIPAAGSHKYDFMSFGEAMVRFTPPGHDRFGQAEELGKRRKQLGKEFHKSFDRIVHFFHLAKLIYESVLRVFTPDHSSASSD